MAQIFDGENIDEFDKLLSISQHFPYQNFPLIIFFACQTTFSRRALSLVYAPMQNISLSKYVYHYSLMEKQWSIATRAFQTDQQSCTITYIAITISYISMVAT